MQKLQYFRGYDDSWLPPYAGHAMPPRGGGRFMRPQGPPRTGFRGQENEGYGYRDFSSNSYGYVDNEYYGHGGGYDTDDYGFYGSSAPSGGYNNPVGRGGRGGRGGGPLMQRGHPGMWQQPQPSWRPWSGGRGGVGAASTPPGSGGNAQWGGVAHR